MFHSQDSRVGESNRPSRDSDLQTLSSFARPAHLGRNHVSGISAERFAVVAVGFRVQLPSQVSMNFRVPT
jgi:hypothetical protein